MIDDALYIVGGIFVLAISLLVIVLASNTLRNAIVGDAATPGIGLDAANNATMSSVFNRMPKALDNAFGFAVLAVMGGSLALLYFIETTPALFFVIVIIEGLLLIVSGLLANAWAKVGESFTATLGDVPKMDFIMSHWLVFVSLYFLLAMVIFFAKPGGSSPQA